MAESDGNKEASSSTDSDIVKSQPSHVFAELASLENIRQPIKSSTRIKYTSLSVGNRHIAVGTTTGALHIFVKDEFTFIATLIADKGRSAVTDIEFSPFDDSIIAIAFKSGVIAVSRIDYSSRGSNEKNIRLVNFLKDSSISVLHWAANGSKVLVGAENGLVCSVDVTDNVNKLFAPAVEVVLRLDSGVVQIDSLDPYLLVSTRTRTYICDAKREQFRQVGKKLRDSAQGACFYRLAGLEEPIIYCARPGSRLWEVSADGHVICTHQFKRLLNVPPAPYISVIEENQEPSASNGLPGPQSIAFPALHMLSDKYLVSLSEKGLYVFNPAEVELLLWTNSLNFKDIIGYKIQRNDVYLMFSDSTLRRFTLLSIPKLVVQLCKRSHYLKAAEICRSHKTHLTKHPHLPKYGFTTEMLNEMQLAVCEDTNRDVFEELKAIVEKYESSDNDSKISAKCDTTESSESGTDQDLIGGKPRSTSIESQVSYVDDTALVQRVKSCSALKSAKSEDLVMESTPMEITKVADTDTISVQSNNSGTSLDIETGTKQTAVDKAQKKLFGFKTRLLNHVTSIGNTLETEVLNRKNKGDTVEKQTVENSSPQAQTKIIFSVDSSNPSTEENDSVDNSERVENNTNGSYKPLVSKDMDYLDPHMLGISKSVSCDDVFGEPDQIRDDTLAQINPEDSSRSSENIAVFVAEESASASPIKSSQVKKRRAKLISFDSDGNHVKALRRKMKRSKSDSNMTTPEPGIAKSKSIDTISEPHGTDENTQNSAESANAQIAGTDTSLLEKLSGILEMDGSHDDVTQDNAKLFHKVSLNAVKDKLQTKAKSLVKTIKDTKDKINPKPEYLNKPLDVAQSTQLREHKEEDEIGGSTDVQSVVDISPLISITEQIRLQSVEETEPTVEDLTAWARILNDVTIRQIIQLRPELGTKKCENCHKVNSSTSNEHIPRLPNEEKMLQESDDIITNGDTIHDISGYLDATNGCIDTPCTKESDGKKSEIHCIDCQRKRKIELFKNFDYLVRTQTQNWLPMNDTVMESVKMLLMTCIKHSCFGDIDKENVFCKISQDELFKKELQNDATLDNDISRENSCDEAVNSDDKQTTDQSKCITSSTAIEHLNVDVEGIKRDIQGENDFLFITNHKEANGDVVYASASNTNVPRKSCDQEHNPRASKKHDYCLTADQMHQESVTRNFPEVKDAKLEYRPVDVSHVHGKGTENTIAFRMFLQLHWSLVDKTQLRSYIHSFEDTRMRFEYWCIMTDFFERAALEEDVFSGLLISDSVQSAIHLLKTGTLKSTDNVFGCVVILFKTVPKWALHVCASVDMVHAVRPIDVLYLCRYEEKRSLLLDFVILYLKARDNTEQQRKLALQSLAADFEMAEVILTTLLETGKPAAKITCDCGLLPLPNADKEIWKHDKLLTDFLVISKDRQKSDVLRDLCQKFGFWSGVFMCDAKPEDKKYLQMVVIQLWDMNLINQNGYWPKSDQEWLELLLLMQRLSHNSNLNDDHLQMKKNKTIDLWCLNENCRRCISTSTHQNQEETGERSVTPENKNVLCNNEERFTLQSYNAQWHKLALALLQGLRGKTAINLLKSLTWSVGNIEPELPFSFYQQCVYNVFHEQQNRRMMGRLATKVDNFYAQSNTSGERFESTT